MGDKWLSELIGSGRDPAASLPAHVTVSLYRPRHHQQSSWQSSWNSNLSRWLLLSIQVLMVPLHWFHGAWVEW